MTNVQYTKILIIFCIMVSIYGCAPLPSIKHQYNFNIVDVKGIPISDAIINIDVYDRTQKVKDTLCKTDYNGLVNYIVLASPDPNFNSRYVKSYNTQIKYTISKNGYYSISGELLSHYGNDFPSDSKPIETREVVLIEPSNYLTDNFLSTNINTNFKTSIIKFINLLLTTNSITNSSLELNSIDISDFKNNKYFTLKMNNENSYNSLKMNKYDIGKELFDDVIRPLLTLLNDNIPKDQIIFGYDIKVIGHTKNFVDKYASDEDLIYRFILPLEISKKYKNKDITGQQLIDSSVILLNDERIDLKLQ